MTNNCVSNHSCLFFLLLWIKSVPSVLQCTCTELRKFLCTWLGECCRQVEAEVVSNSRKKTHQTWRPLFSPPLYTNRLYCFTYFQLCPVELWASKVEPQIRCKSFLGIARETKREGGGILLEAMHAVTKLRGESRRQVLGPILILVRSLVKCVRSLIRLFCLAMPRSCLAMFCKN